MQITGMVFRSAIHRPHSRTTTSSLRLRSIVAVPRHRGDPKSSGPYGLDAAAVVDCTPHVKVMHKRVEELLLLTP